MDLLGWLGVTMIIGLVASIPISIIIYYSNENDSEILKNGDVNHE